MHNNIYLENKIKELLSEMSSSFYELHERYEHDQFINRNADFHEEEEIRGMIKSSFYINAKTVFRLICNYMENANHKIFLSDFKKKIEPFLIDESKVIKGELNDFDMKVHSKLIDNISDFLSAYEFYGERGHDYLLKRAGITYLENILDNTGVILNDLNCKPTSETKVYKKVKFVCKAAFPTAVYPNSPFLSIAKEYKPDILIPYLNCAIEFKYATTESKLKETIDQILIDVKGYSNHDVYKIFYAVFYVKPDLWGRKKFQEVWQEKGFPKNWKSIYIVG